ncbi:uncharacterized protein K452DRAFT_273014 [Aplosporella prunicola CBS 121167]|uniref:Uncharacterized protein n=1 Tax=Aplosporella prunicola CBS 121167 TaxID=1176127 RepID=A0A6A6B8M1_9PEZI|nr:uncharacterized protein K452DRAFT_273014 [Aplosporella prunicola CBS 121167]KAF2140460.1 hypothetical protein K452DRAFT_273014 [Aplosporella prunicola CBS 121167]
MAAPKPCWFLAPRAYPPNGPIKLGNIITDPQFLDEPLSSTLEPLPSSEEVITYEEQDFKFRNIISHSRRVGILTSFLQSILGLGVDAYGNWEKSHGREFDVRNMTTRWFTPTLGFVQSRVAEDAVKGFITRHRFRNKVYMVTGTMIASGASTSTSIGRERGGGVSLSVDATPFGAPVSTGPNFHLGQKTETGLSSLASDDFVFAYRLREIKVKRGGEVVHKSYNKGGLFGTDKRSEEKEQLAKEDAKIQVVVEGVKEEDVFGDAFGMEDEDGIDEASGEECYYVLPE